jgi:hypothetical protein
VVDCRLSIPKSLIPSHALNVFKKIREKKKNSSTSNICVSFWGN